MRLTSDALYVARLSTSVVPSTDFAVVSYIDDLFDNIFCGDGEALDMWSIPIFEPSSETC